jgi:3-hydroxyisobutyrate dehydrogenase-like beta-hydroxyacid dehydrogenase
VNIAVLHPGEMGVSVAATLANGGHEVYWIEAGRSSATADRAAPFTALASLDELNGTVDGVVSVCPPGSALAQAQAVEATGYRGLYVDANAVSPSTAAQVADVFGGEYVDGGIIGPPALRAGTTRMYLSGARAGEVAALFDAGPLTAIAFAEERTAASVLKMAYAAYTKGSSALLLLVYALAEQAGVREALNAEWAISQPGLADRSAKTAAGTSRKAWRFVGEMEEIAETFRGFDLPGEFHDGAAALYERMASLKDMPPADLESVIRAILASR